MTYCCYEMNHFLFRLFAPCAVGINCPCAICSVPVGISPPLIALNKGRSRSLPIELHSHAHVCRYNIKGCSFCLASFMSPMVICWAGGACSHLSILLKCFSYRHRLCAPEMVFCSQVQAFLPRMICEKSLDLSWSLRWPTYALSLRKACGGV